MEHSVSLSRNLSLVWCGNICIIDHPVPRCPFAFSIVYTFVHMLMFSLYYVFFASEQFSSAVTQGVQRFLEWEYAAIGGDGDEFDHNGSVVCSIPRLELLDGKKEVELRFIRVFRFPHN